ncbi:MAG TPA: polysaccharide pyruvyl transferase family protein [Candidatus Saccharimonadales bacterium]|nr:polysaccharide pyruvyl transferase family protein [Candidatus Saccharimonadales bacterium]
MKRKKVLLLGSYGQSNLGDDLLMWNYLELLREKGYEEIYVNANTVELIPQPVKKAYPELRVVNTYKTSLLEYIRLIKKVDCVVYGGGTLYKELYTSTGRSPYSVIVRLMAFNILTRLLGTKLYHLNIGIGSLKTRMGRLISKLALGAATLTIFRDETSYQFAKNTLGVSTHKIKKSVDGLFLNHIWERPWHQAKLQIDRRKNKQVIGINVLSDIPDWINREQYLSTIKRFVGTLLDQGYHVIFIPFQYAFNPRSDLIFMRETFKDTLKGRSNYTLLNEVPIDLVGSYLRHCDLFVGMRFHSLLLGTVNRVPYVAVAYDTKCWRFVEETNYRYAIELEKLQVDKLLKLCQKAIASQDKIKRQLDDISKQSYKEAEDGLRTLNL